MRFDHATLPNGLTVLAESNPAAATAAIGFFVKTGSRDESPEASGVSHFLEHMMFKGTGRRTTAQVNRQFDEIGADYNAATTEETTVYYASVLSEHLPKLIDLMADIMQPALREEDFSTEKSVILEEIALYEDQPRFRVYDTLMSLYFGAHPLGNVILGTPRTIAAMTTGQMMEYFRRRYSPSNIVLAAAGKVDFAWLRESAHRLCGHWSGQQISPRVAQVPAGASARQILHDARLAREHVGFMSPAPSAQDDDRFAAQVLSAIVGDDTGSMLYYDLVETALVDEISLGHAAMDGEGVFMTFLSADPRKARAAVEATGNTIRRFMHDGPTDSQLTAARNKIATGITLKGELPMGRLADIAGDWVYRNDYMPLEDQIARLLAVDCDDVRQVAARYDPASAAMLALGPLENL